MREMQRPECGVFPAWIRAVAGVSLLCCPLV